MMTHFTDICPHQVVQMFLHSNSGTPEMCIGAGSGHFFDVHKQSSNPKRKES